MYWIAINSYRSSTDNGFGNTWRIERVESRRLQRRLLTDGLPVDDVTFADRSPVYSTMGIRLATPQEIRAAKRDIETYGAEPYGIMRECDVCPTEEDLAEEREFYRQRDEAFLNA